MCDRNLGRMNDIRWINFVPVQYQENPGILGRDIERPILQFQEF